MSTQHQQEYSALYTKYQSQGRGNIAQFCREEQLSYDNFIHYCHRQKHKHNNTPLAPVVFGKHKNTPAGKSDISDIKILYPNGVSIQIETIPLSILEQLIHLYR